MRLYPSHAQDFCLKTKRKSLGWLILLLGGVLFCFVFSHILPLSWMDTLALLSVCVCLEIESFKIFYIEELVFEIHIILNSLLFFFFPKAHDTLKNPCFVLI